jgi:hypothetical protein
MPPYWLCQGGREPYPEDQSYGSGAVLRLGELASRQGEGALKLLLSLI